MLPHDSKKKKLPIVLLSAFNYCSVFLLQLHNLLIACFVPSFHLNSRFTDSIIFHLNTCRVSEVNEIALNVVT